jgi:hypothetical protein
VQLAIHQNNFCPWFPFFEKMAVCDVFVLMKECQYEKNSWTNRCQVNGKYWTNPVNHGNYPIKDKTYTTGHNLSDVNEMWIRSIAMTLGIDTNKISYDVMTNLKGTERIVELCKLFKCNEYLTNPEATEAYLDEKTLNLNGINLIPFVSKNKRHVFELFNEVGIESTRKILAKTVKEYAKH